MDHMTEVLRKYEQLMGCDTTNGANGEQISQFWDAVVLTATDEQQAETFRLQIAQKLETGLIPRGLPYKVYADPPGCKIGSGGGLLNALSMMKEEFASKLFQWRVLLINCGGLSQRLPHQCVTGKVFCALPKPNFSMFEYKLAAYLPFLERMNPGIYHVASDDIVAYSLTDMTNDWDFRQPGITALAHPSTIEVGMGHGVFVLKNLAGSDSTSVSGMHACLKVLQKPTLSEMKEAGAIVKSFNGSNTSIVFTDSSFYFDHSVTQKFLKFHQDNAPIYCELDAYGDFQQMLGENASMDYLSQGKGDNLNARELRTKLYQLLHGTPLHVLVLRDSKFFHLGTMPEYIEHFKLTGELSRYLSFCGVTGSFGYAGNDTTVINSHVPSCVIGRSTVIEFCQFEQPVTVGNGCIISGCHSQIQLTIPDNFFVHTIPVSYSKCGDSRYVTIFFCIFDNIKARDCVKFCNLDMKQALKYLKIPVEVASSLWEAKIFPVFELSNKSFEYTVMCINNLNRKQKMMIDIHKDYEFVSMSEVMKNRDFRKMLSYRQQLRSMIELKNKSA